MIDLAELAPQFDDGIDALLEDIAAATPAELGPTCEDLTGFLQTAGIAALLLDLDPDGFQHMLLRAGLTRAYHLEHTPPPARDASRWCKISRAGGFFSAVAAGQLDLARRIVAAGPQQRNPRFEYEEDYAYVRFLHGLLLAEPEGALKALLDAWKKLLDGGASARLGVCRALLGRDPAVFDGAFTRLLDARADELLEEERSMSRDETAFAGARYVFIEGLALLRFATGLGIATQPEHTYCPREARFPVGTPFPDDRYPR